MPVQVPKHPSVTKRKVESERVHSNDAKEESVFTEEQKEAVDQIRKCNDYYEILGLNKDASDADLRKQYKKLALQFHPDKNKAPGAVEAFKAIGTAFSVLNDPAKRKQYDTYGLDAMNATDNNSFRQQYAAYGSNFEGDISPEELYNMFFQGHHTFVRRGSQWQRYYTTRTSHHSFHEEHNRSTLMQILPLIIIVLVSMFSSFFVSEPPYSLQKSSKYKFEQRTSNLDIPYYVKDNFLKEFKDRLAHIEKNVEDEYIITVRTSCFRERNYKESMIFRAKHFKDVTLEAKARELRTPSCDMLNSLYKTLSQ